MLRTLTRPEGSRPEDLKLSRRALGGAVFGGYAVYALAADAQPIQTDEAGLVTETVQLPAADRPIPAYVARPAAAGRFPVVMVISEVFGVHEYIRDTCRRLAKLGYAAVAPDFFVRAGRDPAQISDFAQIREIVSTASDAQVMGDIRAGLDFLRRAPWADRRIAITGFCWGGAVVWLACERFREFRCGVAWYGRLSRPKPGEFLGEPERQWPVELVRQLRAPVLGLYAGKDQGIPLADVEAMRAALLANRKRGSEIIVYPEAQHGFHADYRAQYDAVAANDGWRRMLEHFARNGVPPRRV